MRLEKHKMSIISYTIYDKFILTTKPERPAVNSAGEVAKTAE